MKNKLVKDEDLKAVNGGNDAEIAEIARFIKEHDPEYEKEPLDDIPVMSWLDDNLGIYEVYFEPYGTNEYVANSQLTLSHAQLMELLLSKY